MKTAIEFEYTIGEDVIIKAIGMEGRIGSLIKDKDATQYQVIYWWNGSRNVVWMNDWEIQASK